MGPALVSGRIIGRVSALIRSVTVAGWSLLLLLAGVGFATAGGFSVSLTVGWYTLAAGLVLVGLLLGWDA